MHTVLKLQLLLKVVGQKWAPRLQRVNPVLKLPYLESLPDTNGEVQVGMEGGGRSMGSGGGGAADV
jgi:hypothetical protein